MNKKIRITTDTPEKKKQAVKFCLKYNIIWASGQRANEYNMDNYIGIDCYSGRMRTGNDTIPTLFDMSISKNGKLLYLDSINEGC